MHLDQYLVASHLPLKYVLGQPIEEANLVGCLKCGLASFLPPLPLQLPVLEFEKQEGTDQKSGQWRAKALKMLLI